MLPPSRSISEIPRFVREITQLVTVMLRKSDTLSVPNLMAALVEVSVQLLTTMFSQGPSAAFFSVVLKTMQSSADSIWQLQIRTLRQWSGSMPSQLTIFRLFKMRMPSISTSSQPTRCTVQNALRVRVTSRMVRWRTLFISSIGMRG